MRVFQPASDVGLSLKTEWQQIFSALQDLRIRADLNNAVASILPLIYNSSRFFLKPFRTVPREAVTNGISVTLMFHNGKIQVFAYHFAFFYFYPVVPWNAKIHQMTSPFFLLINTRSGFLAEIRWFARISNSKRILGISSLRRTLLCVNTIQLHGQILISCTIPSELHFPPIRYISVSLKPTLSILLRIISFCFTQFLFCRLGL